MENVTNEVLEAQLAVIFEQLKKLEYLHKGSSFYPGGDNCHYLKELRAEANKILLNKLAQKL